MKCARPCSTNLISVKRELNRWPRSQPRRTALPEAMWQSAAARSEGVGPVARVLRLDYYKLKRLSTSMAPPLAFSAPPTFVELTLSPPANETSVCPIELEDRIGAKMRMVAPGDAGTLVAVEPVDFRNYSEPPDCSQEITDSQNGYLSAPESSPS